MIQCLLRKERYTQQVQCLLVVWLCAYMRIQVEDYIQLCEYRSGPLEIFIPALIVDTCREQNNSLVIKEPLLIDM